MTWQKLNERFGIPGVVAVVEGAGGLPRVDVTAGGATGQVYVHGGHVTHYQPVGFAPVLFCSKDSLYADGKAIRGGVPIIFPWFGANATVPKAPQHGFVRSKSWELTGVEREGEGVRITLTFLPNADTRAVWPHEFELRHIVTFSPDKLDMVLEAKNPSQAPFTFEAALHTYLSVGDVRQTKVEGLSGRTYIDKVDKFERKQQGEGTFTLDGETDRVYLATTDTVKVHDTVGRRVLTVAKEGSTSTVVWNPWAEKVKGMADFGNDEWPNMICVETANAADDARTVAPESSHRLRSIISAEAVR